MAPTRPPTEDPRPPPDAIDLQRTADAVRHKLFGSSPREHRLGRFVVDGYAGDGAMGRVYVAYDPSLDRRVALKMMHADTLRGGERGRRLVEEAKALAKLTHPNVVPVYEIGEIDDEVFVAMELVEGSDLRDWLVDETRTWQEVLRVFIQAAQGVAAAHAVGLIHRDFKPANVIVGGDGRTRVVDFGLARAGAEESESPGATSSALPRATAAAGTPAYMAPEVLAGEPASARSDQYSVGVALHEALHGSAGRVPAWLDRAVAKSRSEDPRERYPSMDAFIATLRSDPGRRRRRLLIAAAVAVGVAGAYWMGSDASAVDCSAADELAPTWNPDRATALVTAFEATGDAQAPHAARYVVQKLDRYAAEWIELREQSCRAQASGQTTERAATAVEACLDDRRFALAAHAEVLLEPDDKLILKAYEVVGNLPLLHECSDAESWPVAHAVPGASEATERVQELLARAKATTRAGRYDAAGEAAREALEGAVELGDEVLRARAENWVGTALRHEGKLDEASDMLLAASSRAEAAGEDRIAARAMIERMSVVGYRQRKFEVVRGWEPQIEAKLARAGRLGTLDEAYFAWAAGVIAAAAADYERAFTRMRRALELREALLGPEHPHVANTLGGIAIVHQQQHQLEDAERLLQRALAIHKAAKGDEHPSVAKAEYNLANTYRLQERYGDALRLFETSLARYQRLLGADHVEVAGVHNDLGVTFDLLGRIEEAREHYERALAIRESRLGPTHTEVAMTLHNIAILEARLERPERARELIERALSIHDDAHGPDHPATAGVRLTLSTTLKHLGELDAALAAGREALRAFEATLGPDSVPAAIAHTTIAGVQAERGELPAAEAAYRRALEIQRSNDVSTGLTAGGLGHILLERGEVEEAARVFDEGRADIEERKGPQHPDLLSVLEGLGRVALARGKRDADALSLIDRAREIAKNEAATDAQRTALAELRERLAALPGPLLRGEGLDRELDDDGDRLRGIGGVEGQDAGEGL